MISFLGFTIGACLFQISNRFDAISVFVYLVVGGFFGSDFISCFVSCAVALIFSSAHFRQKKRIPTASGPYHATEVMANVTNGAWKVSLTTETLCH